MNTVVVAGAGAGKTHALVRRYLTALLGLDADGTPRSPERVWAVTFTENAACEMRERIAATLERLLLQRDDAGDADPLVCELIALGARRGVSLPDSEALRALWEGVHDAPICTFHALCARLLRQYGTAVGMSPRLSLLSPQQQHDLMHRLGRETVLQTVGDSDSPARQLLARVGLGDAARSVGVVPSLLAVYEQLNEQGTAAWAAPTGVTTERAGVNSAEKLAERTKMDSRLRGNDKVGWNDTLPCHPCAGRGASRLAKSAGSEEKHTLSLSFPRRRGPREVPERSEDTLWGKRRESTEKASNSRLTDFLEIPFRRDDKVGGNDKEGRDPWQNLQQAMRAAQSDKLDPPAQAALAAADAALAELHALLRPGIAAEEVAVVSAFEHAQQALAGLGRKAFVRPVKQALRALGVAVCDAFSLPQAQAVRQLSAALDDRVRAHVSATQALRFADLLALTVALLRQHPRVRQEVQARMDRLLVDECQDTSPVQAELLALLAERRDLARALQPHQSAFGALPLQSGLLFAVGDPKQSIYGFRGADAGLFGRLVAKVTGDGGRRENLPTCRRCQGAIVRLVNQVAQATLARGQDGVPFGDADRLQSLRADLGRAGQLWRVRVQQGQDVNEAAARVVARQVRALLQQGACNHLQTCSGADVVVLVRRLAEGARVRRALEQQGVRARLVGGESLFQRQEIADIVSALHLALHPDDELAALIALRSPLIAVPDSQLPALLDGRKIASLFTPTPADDADVAEGIDDASRDAINRVSTVTDPKVNKRLRAFNRLLQDVREQLRRGELAQAAATVVHREDYGSALALEDDWRERLANVEHLLWQAAAAQDDPLDVVETWWSMVRRPPRATDADSAAPPDVVRIMTIHQAKGLEFPVVVLTDTLSSSPSEADDALFDPDVGLAVSVRARPIAALAPKRKSGATDDDAVLAIDAVRARRRARSTAELARLLYVAMTRARDHLYVVDAVRGEGEQEKLAARSDSLAALLQQGREQDPETFDALLPTVTLEADSPCHPEQQQSDAPCHPERSEPLCHPRAGGDPKRRDAIHRVSTTVERAKMDSCLRGNDKVGGPASNVDENACSAKDNTLLLSFPRRRESPHLSKHGEILPHSVRQDDRRDAVPPSRPQPLGVVRLTPSRLARAYYENMRHRQNDAPLCHSGPTLSFLRKQESSGDPKCRDAINRVSTTAERAKTQQSTPFLPQPELGNLAHALLADVSLRLSSGDRPWAERDLRTWLRAALANQGKRQEDPVAGQASALAYGTLRGAVGEMIRQADWVSFEHPVAYLIRQNILIEGKADLVLQGPWGLGVIDFKSSHGAVTSRATFAQLCGYARAFVDDGKQRSPPGIARTSRGNKQRPVWMAAARLGDPAPPVRLPYDDQAESVLQRSVRLAFEQVRVQAMPEDMEVQ